MAVPGSAPITEAGLDELLRRSDIRDVGTRRVAAERLGNGVAASIDLDLTAEATFVEDGVDFAVVCQCQILDESRAAVAEISAELVVGYRFPSDAKVEGTPTVGARSESRALRVAYPYLRETVQSMAARLGLPGLVLGTVIAAPVGGADSG